MVFLLYCILLFGVKINSFHISNFEVSQFYIKIDKKLIVTIENIEQKSNKSKVNSSFQEIKNTLELLPKILRYFQIIDIKNLNINENRYKILFNNDTFTIDNKFISLNSKINTSSKEIVFDISSLYLKDYEVLFKGKAVANYFYEELKYFGDIYYKDIDIKANVDVTKNKLSFFIRSDYFENLHFLKPFLNLNNIANSWIYDNVVGDFKLDWLYGEFDLKKQKLIFKSLQGNAHIKDAKIRFHPSLKQINTSSVKVNYKNDTLRFDLINPKYKNKNLDNSFVEIQNLTNKDKGKVLVNIQTKASLDKDIINILKAYDITLPVTQKYGQTDAKLLLDFPYSNDLPMSTNGDFKVEKSDISIGNFSFKTNGANVSLDNSLLYINEASFLYKDMIDTYVNIKLDLKSLKANGNLSINKILIKSDKNEQLLSIKDEKSNISMDFDNNVDIYLDDFKTNIKYDNLLIIKLDNIAKFYKYSNILKNNSIKNGNAVLKIVDDKQIDFEGSFSGFALPIKKDNKNIESLKITGEYQNGNVDIYSEDKNISLNIQDNNYNLKLNGYDIFYDTTNNFEISNDIEKINILATNSKIVLNNQNLFLADFYEIVLDKNRKFLYLEYKDAKMSFNQNKNGYIDTYIAKANDNFVNALLNKSVMSKGKVNFYVNGYLDNLEGKILIEESDIENLTILNNILFILESSPALINPLLAIPSLLGSNQLGRYHVKDGIIDFVYNHNTKILDIQNLHSSGNGIDFEGKAVINLDTNEINSDLKLIFFKTYTSIVDSIPILNYILLGDEQRVETQLDISGDFNEPTIKTNIFKDGTKATWNIIKRVYKTPENLIKNIKNKDE